jgi:hypothetical protein
VSEGSFVAFGRPGSDLLSRVLRRSTIGAGAFHGRVRNGIGCSHPAVTTRSAKRNKLMRSWNCLFCPTRRIVPAGTGAATTYRSVLVILSGCFQEEVPIQHASALNGKAARPTGRRRLSGASRSTGPKTRTCVSALNGKAARPTDRRRLSGALAEHRVEDPYVRERY